jgi:hypothetical protein
MQELHLVGFTADFDGLIFSVRRGAKSGSYRVSVDEALIDAVAELRRVADERHGEPDTAAGDRIAPPPAAARQPAPRRDGPSALSPRQIQDRIRTGWSVEAVADEAGTSTDWIQRFAHPVLAELDAVVARARDAWVVKARAGRSSLPLAAAVRRNLLDRSVRPTGGVDTGWSAFLLEPGAWVVRFDYDGPNGPQRAEWLFDGTSGDLMARDRKAADLGFVAPPRPAPVARAAKPEPEPEPEPSEIDTAVGVGAESLAPHAEDEPPPRPARSPRRKATTAASEPPLELVEPPAAGPARRRAR